jgi:predicted nucleotidyltransferase
MRTLASILERQEKRRKALEKNLPRVVEQLQALGALQVILFGSLVRGEVGARSDLDLIAIMPSSLSSREWMRKVYAEVERGIACDILVYNASDWQEMLPISRFLRHALREGVVIYEAGSAGGSAALADPGQG